MFEREWWKEREQWGRDDTGRRLSLEQKEITLVCTEGRRCERALISGEGDRRQQTSLTASSRYWGSVGYSRRCTRPGRSWGMAENGYTLETACVHVHRPVIQLLLDLCPICQETKGKKSKHKIIHKPIIPETVGVREQADLADLQLFEDNGYKFILNSQDCFSKFIILRTLKTKTTVEVADCLMGIFFEHAHPHSCKQTTGLSSLTRR